MLFDARDIEREAKVYKLTNENRPTDFSETFFASAKMQTAAENTNSRMNYIGTEMEAQAEKLSELSPDNADFFKAYANITPKDAELYKFMSDEGRVGLKDGEVVALDNRSAAFVQRDGHKIKSFLIAQQKLQEHGLGDYNDALEAAKTQAKTDYTEARKVSDRGGVVPQLLGGMWGAMQDPFNLMLIPFGAEAGAATMLGRAGERFAQEAALATMAEIPIQMQAFDWKNEIGLDWDIKDSLASAALSIGAAGVLSSGVGATIDVVKPVKPKTPEEQFYKNMMDEATIKDQDEHIGAMQSARMQVERGERVSLPEDTKLSDAPDVYADKQNFDIEYESKLYDAEDYDQNVVAYGEQNKKNIEGYADIEKEEAGLQKVIECAL